MFAYTASYSTLANHAREDAVALSWPSVCRYRLSTHMLAASRVDAVDRHCILERHYLPASIAVDVGAPRREIYIPLLGARSRCCILFSLPPELSTTPLRRSKRFISISELLISQGYCPLITICILFLLIVFVPVSRQTPKLGFSVPHS